MYKLENITQDKNINTIPINSDCSIGRGKNNDILINDISVSTNHIKIYLDNNQIYIEDLNSTNGTYIDEHKLEVGSQYELNLGQTLRLGTISYKLIDSQSIKTNDKEFTIGRSIDSDIVINIDTVSSTHLKINKINNEWYIIDNNSTNGTYIGSYHIDNKIDKIKLEKNQIIYLSSYKLNSNEIFNLLDNKKSQTTLIKSDITTIGRDPNSTLHINNINVSWNHAKIIYENGKYFLYDLNSTNGTFVNEKEIKDKEEIVKGNKITLGLYSFIFQDDKNSNLSLLNLNKGGFTIDVKDVAFQVKTVDDNGKAIVKNLIKDINLTVYPGEIVGLMGLSGAGKTTLLKTLSGYTKPTQGNVFVNGLDLYKNFDKIKNSIGYVPQEDIIHPELTVYEALFYSLKLRTKEKLTINEINQRIDNILDELGFVISGKNDIKKVKIGSPDEKGTSGGQRKRINIAMELLANPEIIFLDEPTSGLSSVDATMVMDKLKELADKGKTIILTIHQPSLVNYKKMDDMIILTNGELAYFGPNYPDSIKFFNENSTSQEILNDPDMALMGLHKGESKNINWSNKYQNSDIYDKFVKDRGSLNNSDNISSVNNSPSLLMQLKTLTSRYLKIKIKDRLNTAILLIQAPIIAILLAFLFTGEGKTFHEEHPNILLFILVISSMWFGIINSVKEIVSEKAIYERERLIGLKIFPYIFSKFLILSLLSLIQVIVLILIVTTFITLKVNIINLLILIFITALSGLAIGLLTSAIAKSVSQALSLVPIILLPMIIFGGGMIPINKLSSKPYEAFNAYNISFLMPTRWALEEAIRIFDKENDDISILLREPNVNESGIKIFKNQTFRADNSDALGDILCQDRRCIESLYIKPDVDNNTSDRWISRASTTTNIYIILLLFIFIPIILVMLILYKRDKS